MAQTLPGRFVRHNKLTREEIVRRESPFAFVPLWRRS